MTWLTLGATDGKCHRCRFILLTAPAGHPPHFTLGDVGTRNEGDQQAGLKELPVWEEADANSGRQ